MVDPAEADGLSDGLRIRLLTPLLVEPPVDGDAHDVPEHGLLTEHVLTHEVDSRSDERNGVLRVDAPEHFFDVRRGDPEHRIGEQGLGSGEVAVRSGAVHTRRSRGLGHARLVSGTEQDGGGLHDGVACACSLGGSIRRLTGSGHSPHTRRQMSHDASSVAHQRRRASWKETYMAELVTTTVPLDISVYHRMSPAIAPHLQAG